MGEKGHDSIILDSAARASRFVYSRDIANHGSLAGGSRSKARLSLVLKELERIVGGIIIVNRDRDILADSYMDYAESIKSRFCFKSP